jgi:hypothetical protein
VRGEGEGEDEVRGRGGVVHKEENGIYTSSTPHFTGYKSHPSFSHLLAPFGVLIAIHMHSSLFTFQH